jgi:hypothetical protein
MVRGYEQLIERIYAAKTAPAASQRRQAGTVRSKPQLAP